MCCCVSLCTTVVFSLYQCMHCVKKKNCVWSLCALCVYICPQTLLIKTSRTSQVLFGFGTWGFRLQWMSSNLRFTESYMYVSAYYYFYLFYYYYYYVICYSLNVQFVSRFGNYQDGCCWLVPDLCFLVTAVFRKTAAVICFTVFIKVNQEVMLAVCTGTGSGSCLSLGVALYGHCRRLLPFLRLALAVAVVFH